MVGGYRIFCGPEALYRFSERAEDVLQSLPLVAEEYDISQPLASFSDSTEINSLLWFFAPRELIVSQERKNGRSNVLRSVLQETNEWRLTVDHARAVGGQIHLAATDDTPNKLGLPSLQKGKAPPKVAPSSSTPKASTSRKRPREEDDGVADVVYKP